MEGHVGLCGRADISGQEDACPWCSHVGVRGWKDRGAWPSLGLSEERKKEWGALAGKRSVSRLRLQKPSKLSTQELEDNMARDGPQDELTHWQLHGKGSVVKAGVGTANKQTNPMWSNASNTEQVEDSLVANGYPGAVKEGIVLSLPIGRAVFLHLGRISNFHRAQIFGETCFTLRQLKIVGWNVTDQRTFDLSWA